MNNKSVDLLLDVIERLPGSKVRPLSVALHYMSEDVERGEDVVVGYLKMLEFVIDNGLRFVEEEVYVRKKLDVLTEDGAVAAGDGGAPTNSVAGVQPTDEPVIDGAAKKNKRKSYADLFARSTPA